MPDGGILRPVGIDRIRREPGKNDEFLSRPRHGDVQPSFATIAVQGAEIHCQLACHVFPEGDREHDHVAFVALDVLQVLHDRRFDPVVGEKPFELRLVVAGEVEQIEDQRLLLRVEGDDAEGRAIVLRQVKPASHARHRFANHGLRLDAVRPALASVVDAASEPYEGGPPGPQLPAREMSPAGSGNSDGSRMRSAIRCGCDSATSNHARACPMPWPRRGCSPDPFRSLRYPRPPRCDRRSSSAATASDRPTMIVCRPRAMAPTASHVVICEASSKMTTSNSAWFGGRYWAIDSGDISMQGASLGKDFRHLVDHVADRLARPLQFHLVAQQAEFRVAGDTRDGR